MGTARSDLIVPESLSIAIYHDIDLMSGSAGDGDEAQFHSACSLSRQRSFWTMIIDSDGKTDLLVISAQARTMSFYRNTSSIGRMTFVLDQTLTDRSGSGECDCRRPRQ
jgi:hypothetical protein